MRVFEYALRAIVAGNLDTATCSAGGYRCCHLAGCARSAAHGGLLTQSASEVITQGGRGQSQLDPVAFLFDEKFSRLYALIVISL